MSSIYDAHQYDANKAKVAEQFSKYAMQYDDIATVQQQIAECLLTEMSQHKTLPQQRPWVDLGCGTGSNMAALGKYTHSPILGLDIAVGMLENARQHNMTQPFVQADFEALPLHNASVDVVFSSMALQWCSAPQIVAKELERILAPGGHAFLNVMVAPSFTNLRQAFTVIGHADSVNHFVEPEAWTHAFSEHVILTAKNKTFCADFIDFKTMMNSIKGVGAGVVQDTQAINKPASTDTQNKTLRAINKSQYQTLVNHFSGSYQLDYHVLFLHLHKPIAQDE